MISRFFIDRPIFATVLSVVITLIGLIALVYLPIAQYPRITPPGVVVAISYPGASSQVVADTVAAPIEQQVNGVPGMLYMSSQMGNDGTYALTVTFDLSVDLNTALVMVQNRVTLAMPQLPTQVQNQGITIRKKTPDILMIVNLISPNGLYDDIYLSNYATIFIRDEILRVDGVSDITYQGERDYSIRAWLDPQKLAAMNMTAMDVASAIQNQNLDAPAGQIGAAPISRQQAFQMPIDTIGRLSQPEQFSNIIVKVAQSRATTSVTGVTVSAPASGSNSGTSGGLTGSNNSSMSSGPTTGSSSSSTTGSTTASTTGSTTNSTTTSTGASTAATTTSSGTSTLGSTSGITASSLTSPTSSTTNAASATGGTSGTPSAITALGSAGENSIAAGRGPGLQAQAVVRLADVARVEMGALNYTQSCTFDGTPSVGLGIYQLPGTNALDVADRVRAKMEELKERFPPGVDYRIAYDTTPFIRESVWDVVKTLLEAVALVGLVVLVFLQDWKAMILPLIDVPVSIIGTFAVMAALGFSLNNISLFGLVLAIGIVVDDAIVVLENIERMMAKGHDARTATIKAMDEVTGPIVAVGLVLCAVFVPCAFMSGITGQFFHQFAVTIAVSTVISALNAVTMTPSRAVLIFKTENNEHGHEHVREALPWWIFGIAGGILTLFLLPDIKAFQALRVGTGAGRWVNPILAFLPGLLAGCVVGWIIIRPVNAVLGWLFRGFNRGFDFMTAGYSWTVGRALRLSALVLVLYGGLLLLTYFAFERAPTGFIPQQDQGRLIVNVQLPDSSSLQRTEEAVANIVAVARKTPGVAHVVAISGLSFILQANSSNFASMFIVLDPFDQRQKPELRDTAIMRRLQKGWAANIKDAVVTVYGASPVPGLGVAGGFKLMIEDRGGLGLNALQAQTEKLIGKIKQLPGLNNVTTQFRSRVPQLWLDIDRTKAASLGVAIDDINQTLDMYLGSLYVNSFNDFGRHWQVTIQADGNYRNRVEEISLLQVRNNQGQMVPLGTIVQPREIGGPISITRYNLYTTASITGNIQGVSTGATIEDIERLAAENLPISMKTEWTEIMFMQLRAGNTAYYIFLLSIISVFLALAALYESWSLPLAVILVVPLCLLCSLSGVLATNRDVNIFVQIGLVVLVGLACKNAILVVEYAKEKHRQGQSRFDATMEAARLRLRPILMTSFAFIFGVVPLTIASGAGAEMRRSLGLAVFNGMLGVTVFGVFLTPVFYYVIQGLGETPLFTAASTRRYGGQALGGLLGCAIGFLLGKIGIVRMPWGPIIGAVAGIFIVRGILGFRKADAPALEEKADHG